MVVVDDKMFSDALYEFVLLVVVVMGDKMFVVVVSDDICMTSIQVSAA